MKPITMSGPFGLHGAVEPGRADAAPQPLVRGAGPPVRKAEVSCATMLAGWVAVSAAAIQSAPKAKTLLRKAFCRSGGMVRAGDSAERNDPNDKGQRSSRVPLATQTLRFIPNLSDAPGCLIEVSKLSTGQGELDMPHWLASFAGQGR